MKKCCVIGIGYIGLPTAAILASKGLKVLGVDIDKEKVEKLKNGEIYIKEPNLEQLVKKQISNGNLKVSNIISKNDVFIITVPTPIDNKNNPNLTFIKEASKLVGESIRLLEKNKLNIFFASIFTLLKTSICGGSFGSLLSTIINIF